MNKHCVPVAATSPAALVSPQPSEDEPSTSAFIALGAHLHSQGLRIGYNAVPHPTRVGLVECVCSTWW
jgi:hypothetical protein